MKPFPKHLHHEHTPDAIRRRLGEGTRPSYVRDFVYGGIDGAITTFAIVAGVVGAGLGSGTILILGFANLIADGFSMAAGNYLATKSEKDEKGLIESYEFDQIERNSAGEKLEVREILKEQGYEGELLDQSVEHITEDRERWVKFMLSEEYGIAGTHRSPLRAALSTFAAFIIFGFIPLMPTAFALPSPFFWSCVLTGVAFFLVGSAKGRWSVEPWWRSGLEALGIGVIAAALAYWVGYLLSTYVT